MLFHVYTVTSVYFIASLINYSSIENCLILQSNKINQVLSALLHQKLSLHAPNDRNGYEAFHEISCLITLRKHQQLGSTCRGYFFTEHAKYLNANWIVPLPTLA